MLYIDRDQAVRPNEDENNLAPQRVGIPEKSLDEHRVHVGAEDTQDTIAFPFDEGTLLQHEQYAIRSQQSPPGKKPPGTQAIDPILPCGQAKAPAFATSLRCAYVPQGWRRSPVLGKFGRDSIEFFERERHRAKINCICSWS